MTFSNENKRRAPWDKTSYLAKVQPINMTSA